jgi:hypothetical protein
MGNEVVKLCIDEDNPSGLYQYKLPPMPKESEIWYYNVPQKDQYWKTPANKDFKWLNQAGHIRQVKGMTEKERIEYVNYWRDKWENGLWIMVNGQPTYLTGAHVEHLVFNKFKSSYFSYDDGQRERFYFRDMTNKDPICDGRLWIKGRRVGLTSEEVTEAIRVLLSGFSNNVNCQSDTFPKAKSTLLSKIIDTYVKRVSWMREEFYSANGKIPRSELELITTVISDSDDYPLGGKARAFPTTVKAKDGEEAMLDIMDELSKWVDASPRETFDVNIMTIVNPGRRGKLDALSTTGDSQEAEKAVREWHQLIADSNPKIRNANGKTNSGLYYYFVSYAYSFELWERHPEIKDKYGKVDLEMAEEIIWREINKYPADSKSYIFQLYKMPTRMRHALLTSSNQGYFSKVRISARLEELRSLSYDRKPYMVGALEYDRKGDVFFETNEERKRRCQKEGVKYEPGYWMVARIPYYSIEKGVNLANRYRRDGDGICFPPVNPEGGIGFDPIRYHKEDTTSANLSDAAIIVKKKFDYYGVGDANTYQALYVHRPDDPHDANREAIKACKFWGYPMMYERTMDAVKEDFSDARMLPFLLRSSKDGVTGMVIDSGGKAIQNAITELQTEFSIPKEGEADMIAEHPFEPVLLDLDGVDLKRTTKYNVFMALVEVVYALRQIGYTNQTEKTDMGKMAAIYEIFPPRK